MTNIFMMQVRDSMDFSFRHLFKYLKYKRSLNKFIKKIDTGSPSFGVLWNFAEFIQYAELVYFYDNRKDSAIYSSTAYVPTQTGFKITTDETVIVVKLYSDNKKVGMDIERLKGNKTKSSYVFINEEWTEEPDEYDMLLVDYIIDVINKSMIWMLNYCIDKKLSKKKISN